jgi:ABC-type uncharacterized transport system permease subunit
MQIIIIRLVFVTVTSLMIIQIISSLALGLIKNPEKITIQLLKLPPVISKYSGVCYKEQFLSEKSVRYNEHRGILSYDVAHACA